MFSYNKAIVLELCVEIQNLPCQWSRKHSLKQGRRRRWPKLALKSEKKIKRSATDLLSDSLSYSLLKRLVPFVSWSRCYKAWVLWQAAKSRYHVLASGYCGTISGWFRALSSIIRFLSKLVKRNAYSQWACTWQTSWSSSGTSAYDCPSVAVLSGWTSTQNAVKLLTIILGEYHIEDWVNSTVNVTKPRCGKQKFNRKWFIQWPVVLTKHLQSLKR